MQQELFPASIFDNRCERLYEAIKRNWETRDIDPIQNLDKLQEYGKMYRVDTGMVIRQWNRYTGYECCKYPNG